MPIYEYACRSCEHQFESIQKASEAPLRDCPECGEAALKKLLSAPVFRLKGKGWYETDFKTGDKRNVLEAADRGKDGADAGAEAKAGDAGGGTDKGGGSEGGGTDKGSGSDSAPGKETAGASQDKGSAKQGANGREATPAKSAGKETTASKAGADGAGKPAKR